MTAQGRLVGTAGSHGQLLVECKGFDQSQLRESQQATPSMDFSSPCER